MTSEELAQLKGVIHDTISETTKIATDEVKAAIETHSQGDDHRYIQTMRSKESARPTTLKGSRVISYFTC